MWRDRPDRCTDHDVHVLIMATIYLVMRKGGEYEDKWKYVVCARYAKEAAQAEVERLDAHDQYLRELDERLGAHMATFTPPTLEVPYPTLIDKPRWTGIRHQDITDLMRADRRAIEADNIARQLPYLAAIAARDKERTAEKIRYLIDVEMLSAEDADRKAGTTYGQGKWHVPDDNARAYIDETEIE